VKFRALLVAAAMTVSLAACSDSDDKGSDKPTDSPTPSPVRSTTGTLLDNVPTSPPKRPKDVRSKDGAFAFSAYSVDVIFYALATKDIDALYGIADRELCRACKQVQDGMEKRGNKIQVGKGPQVVSSPKLTSQEGDFYTVRQRVKLPDGAVISPTTGEEYSKLDGSGKVMNVNIRWVKDAWILLDYKFTEDKSA
jgi:hypothetical protein